MKAFFFAMLILVVIVILLSLLSTLLSSGDLFTLTQSAYQTASQLAQP